MMRLFLISLLAILAASVSAISPPDKATLGRALLTAAWHDDYTQVQALLSNGAPVNYRGPAFDRSGSRVRIQTTALHLCSERGDAAMVKLLIAHKANLNLRDDDGNTPLHQATDEGRVEAARILLASGANYRIKNNSDVTPLELTYRREQPAGKNSMPVRKLILARMAHDRRLHRRN